MNKLKVTEIVATLLGLMGFVSADADDRYHMMSGMYGMMSGSYGYSGMFFSWLTGLLVVVALVLLIVWLIKQIQK